MSHPPSARVASPRTPAPAEPAPVEPAPAEPAPGKLLAGTPAATARRMSRQRTRDTDPEILLRRELHRRGLRYRVDAPIPRLPRRRADLLFTRARVAIFVDGCFWHSCPEHRTSPATNAEWWATKLARNVARDRETDAHLAGLGWIVLRFWEHEDPITAADAIVAVVRPAGRGGE